MCKKNGVDETDNKQNSDDNATTRMSNELAELKSDVEQLKAKIDDGINGFQSKLDHGVKTLCSKMERVGFEPGSSSVPKDELESVISKLNSVVHERSKKHLKNKAKIRWADIEVLKRLLPKESVTPKGEETISSSTTTKTKGGSQNSPAENDEETVSAETNGVNQPVRGSVNGESSDNRRPAVHSRSTTPSNEPAPTPVGS